jgi:hypothetical protein
MEKTKELCSKIYMHWFLEEMKDPKMPYKEIDEEFLQNSFITKILLTKFKAFDIDIHLPMPLLALLSMCTDENPGMSQIILKDLLNSIKSRIGAIPKGYVITSTDFAFCFPNSFPIIANEQIYKKYIKLWDEQKCERTDTFKSDNLCDTSEWWREVMQ